MLRKHCLTMSLLTMALLVFISCSSNAARFTSEPQPDQRSSGESVADAESIEPDEQVDPADSSLLEYAYIDSDLQYQLDRAEEDYKFGYSAMTDSNWLEAQIYFESAIELLAGLDIDPDSPTLAADIYSRLINEIISEYKLTLLYIATLPGEASPSAVIARYEELDGMSNGSVLKSVEPEQIPDTVVFDIPISWNEKVEKCVNYFQTVGKKPFEISLARSGKYLPLMEKIFAEEGLPHDLVYLPLIESGFNPRAYSWAHAVGHWQFISSTGRMYGLNRSWWWDERRDFEKSTRAAARHLKDLYKEAGDWYLALLGYNAGMGNVRKMIKYNKTRDYFKMTIRNSQMRNYVPLYLAATIIAKQPEKYGFNIDYHDPIEFDTVTVRRCLALEDIAKAVDCSLQELNDLNPELLRKHTPPDRKSYTVRIPRLKRNAFWAAYPKMKSPEETSWVQHKVRKGETVSGIARKYGISQYAIIDANNMRRPYRINIGQNLTVPVPLGEKKIYSSSSKSNDSYGTADGHYVVRSGDNLWDIAKAFGTTTRELRVLNNLRRDGRIYPGQKLSIPGRGGESYASSSSGSSVTKHKVRKGDSLWKLAEKYGTTINELCRLNGISRNRMLIPGQVLKVPGSGSGSSSSHSSSHYVVRRGDTLSKIAKNFGISLNSLMAWNSITNPRKLSVGTKLRVSAD
ncbi:MAG: LysM peptidoglycan-binding domain-containing protein [Candidatus Zixiibacteriota bacterium]